MGFPIPRSRETNFQIIFQYYIAVYRHIRLWNKVTKKGLVLISPYVNLAWEKWWVSRGQKGKEKAYGRSSTHDAKRMRCHQICLCGTGIVLFAGRKIYIERFSYDLEMKTRERNRNNKRTEIERFHWLMKQMTNTYRNHFSRWYENRSSIYK